MFINVIACLAAMYYFFHLSWGAYHNNWCASSGGGTRSFTTYVAAHVCRDISERNSEIVWGLIGASFMMAIGLFFSCCSNKNKE